MKVFALLGLIALCALVADAVPAKRSFNNKRVVCYFGSWAVYRYGHAKIGVNDIDTSLCTHFIYTFIGLNDVSASVVLLDAWNDVGDDWKKGTMQQIQTQSRATGTKFMVALGGWNEGSERYSKTVCNPAKRTKLVNSIVDFVSKYNLDGFDLDWEYPGQRGGAAGDKECFSALIAELRPIFDRNGWELSAAVSANAKQLPISYNVPDISKNLDFINVMAYDLHGSWEATTGANAPLYGRPDDSEEDAHLNVAAAINAWIDLGASPSKLNLGLGTYGRSFLLRDPNNYGIGAPAVQGVAAPSGWIQEAGFYGFHDICFNNGTSWQTEWDDIGKVPYAHSGSKWVGYDDARSIQEKTCFALSTDLGGIMFWSVETDDFGGICNRGKYPLINAAVSALTSQCGTSIPAPAPTSPPVSTETPEPPSTETPESPSTEAPETPSTEDPQVPSTSEESSEEAEQPDSDENVVTDTPAPDTELPETATESELTTTAEPETSKPSRECTYAGERFRDPGNCAVFYTCISDGVDGFRPIPFICPGGLGFDSTLQSCNYRALLKGC